jgi:methylthioribulose-1-phosphate dehydratase
MSPSAFEQAAEDLVAAGRRFDARGWVLGTSGNFSTVIQRQPLRLAITRSGAHKGALTPDDILEIDEARTSLRGGSGRPSAETQLHFEIVAARAAGAVMHTHSIWSTFLSDRGGADGGVAIDGYEMLKGLDGVATHEHREWIPVIDNDQDIPRLSLVVRRVLADHPRCHAFLLRRHGLYTWGATLPDAVRHVEILEFLLESVGRARYSSAIPEEAAPWRS